MNARRKKLLIVVGIAGALIAVGFLLREPALGLVRSWRYEANLKKAEEAYADEDLVRANQFAGAALRLKRGDLEALRTLMDLGQRIRSADLPVIALARFQHADAMLEDQVAVMELALRTGDLAFASKLHDNLAEDRRAEPAVQFCHADLLERSGRTVEAVELVNGLLESERAEEARFRLTRLLARMEDNPVAYKRARTLVAELIAAGGEHALPAFRNLGLLPAQERTQEGGPDLLKWLESREGALASDFLLAAEIEMEPVGEKARAEIVGAMVSKYRASEPRELARWLLKVGQSKRILDLPEALLREDESFYAARLQVLIDEGRIEETKAWIADPHPKLSPIVVDAVRAGVAFKEGDEPGRVRSWQQAFEKARFGESYGPYLAMYRIAERFGDRRGLRKIATAIVQLPPRLLPATQNLEYLRHDFGDHPEILGPYFRRLEASRPKDPLARHHLALFQIVTGRDTGKAVATLEELTQTHPDLLAFHCSLALGYLGQGDPERALKWLAAREANWNESGADYERAAFALVHARAGGERTARNLRAGIGWERLPGYLRTFLQDENSRRE